MDKVSMKTKKAVKIEVLEAEVKTDTAPKVSQSKLTPNQKLLRKAIRLWARDKIVDPDVPETNKAAILAGFHYAINLMFEIAELKQKAKNEGADTHNITFEHALAEIERMMNDDSYTHTVLSHYRNMAIERGLL